MNTEKERPYLVWDTCDIATEQAKYLQAEHPEEYPDEETAFGAALEDTDIYEWQWEHLTDSLSELMREINPNGLDWTAGVENFGWRKRNGKATFQAETGLEFLRAILPDTDCTFKIYKRDGEIAINNAHHDSPCWAEWYHIRPIKTCVYCGDPADTVAEGDDVCAYCHEGHYQMEGMQ